MEYPQVDQVIKAFYKDEECNKPKFQLLSLKEIEDEAHLKKPHEKYERKYWHNVLRQAIYRIMKFEWEENGRQLISIKMEKGKNKVYGFTKKTALLIAFANDKNKRAKKAICKGNEATAYAKAHTKEESWGQLELIFDDDSVIKIS